MTTAVAPLPFNEAWFYREPTPVAESTPFQKYQQKWEIEAVLNTGKLTPLVNLRGELKTRLKPHLVEKYRSELLKQEIELYRRLPQDAWVTASLQRSEALVEKIDACFRATADERRYLETINHLINVDTSPLMFISDTFPYVVEREREYQAGDFLSFPSDLLPKKGDFIRVSGYKAPQWLSAERRDKTKPTYYVILDRIDSYPLMRSVCIVGLDVTNREYVRLYNSDDAYEQHTSTCDDTAKTTIAWLQRGPSKWIIQDSQAVLETEFPPPSVEHRRAVCTPDEFSIHRTRAHHPETHELLANERNLNFLPRIHRDPLPTEPEVNEQEFGYEQEVLNKAWQYRLETQRREFLSERARERGKVADPKTE